MTVSNLLKKSSTWSLEGSELYRGFAEVQPCVHQQHCMLQKCEGEHWDPFVQLLCLALWGDLKVLCRGCCVVARCNLRKTGELT